MKSLSNFGFLAVSPSEPGLKALKPAAGGALGPEWDIVATGQSCSETYGRGLTVHRLSSKTKMSRG